MTTLRVPPRGLGSTFFDRGRWYVPFGLNEGEDLSSESFFIGGPEGLGKLIARRPLLAVLLLFGGGWLGGYLTWVWIGKRRR